MSSFKLPDNKIPDPVALDPSNSHGSLNGNQKTNTHNNPQEHKISPVTDSTSATMNRDHKSGFGEILGQLRRFVPKSLNPFQKSNLEPVSYKDENLSQGKGTIDNTKNNGDIEEKLTTKEELEPQPQCSISIPPLLGEIGRQKKFILKSKDIFSEDTGDNLPLGNNKPSEGASLEKKPSEEELLEEEPLGPAGQNNTEIRDDRDYISNYVLQKKQLPRGDGQRGPDLEIKQRDLLTKVKETIEELKGTSKEAQIYSEEKIVIDPDQNIQIPVAGRYKAPPELLKDLADELMYQMIYSVTSEKETYYLQTQKDLPRTTDVILKEGDKEDSLIKPLRDKHINSNSSDEYKECFQNMMGMINDFVGDLDVANAILGVLNQTIANMHNLVFTGAHRPSQGSAEEGHFISFNTPGAIGFPSHGAGNIKYGPPIFKFILEKVKPPSGPHYFTLNCYNQSPAIAFQIKYHDGKQANYTAPLPSDISMEAITSAIYKITPTPDSSFTSTAPLTKDNFPVKVECLEFENDYAVV